MVPEAGGRRRRVSLRKKSAVLVEEAAFLRWLLNKVGVKNRTAEVAIVLS